MWTEDVIRACQKLIETLGNYMVTWKEICAAYDGIVFRMDNGTSWKYWYMTETITKLEPWRSVKR